MILQEENGWVRKKKMTRKTKIMNADKNFVKFIRFKYPGPGVSDPERTRRIMDEVTIKDGLSKKIDEMLYGKKKKK